MVGSTAARGSARRLPDVIRRAGWRGIERAFDLVIVRKTEIILTEILFCRKLSRWSPYCSPSFAIQRLDQDLSWRPYFADSLERICAKALRSA
jgi:hypothetical protein